MRVSKLVGLAFLAVGVSACGNSIESKEDAAAAVQRLAYATSKAVSSKPSVSGAADASVTTTVQGQSGTATIRFSVGAELGLIAEVDYDGFSVDGVNTFDGSLSATASFDMGNLLQGMSIDLSMKGSVTMSGDYDSSLEVDLALGMSMSDLENLSGASVSMYIDGRVVADGNEYLFANESITVETTEG